MRKGSSKRTLVDALPYLLGIGILATMFVPQIALYQACRWMVRGALCGLNAYLVVRKSIKESLFFLIICSLFAWICDIEEGVIIIFQAIAGFAMIMVINRSRKELFLRIALGAVLAAVLLMVGVSALAIFRKQSEIVAALRVGAVSEFPTLVVCLLGGLIGGRIASRKMK